MKISLIVAAAENNSIGKNNQLLWHLPNDLKFFKNTTWGMPVIMGRKTFESVSKVLPGRFNIVITTQTNWSFEGVIVANSLQDALDKAATTNCNEAFIIGGGEIYRQCLPIATAVYLTKVHAVVDGDTFFSELSETNWQLTDNKDFEMDAKHMYNYSFQKWERK
ncbi:MAG: dihydrofolate reductase [Chitinophagaceae bacterium]|nr:dihydrofolate reductase [Chitinophagaceae bacterium]